MLIAAADLADQRDVTTHIAGRGKYPSARVAEVLLAQVSVTHGEGTRLRRGAVRDGEGRERGQPDRCANHSDLPRSNCKALFKAEMEQSVLYAGTPGCDRYGYVKSRRCNDLERAFDPGMPLAIPGRALRGRSTP